jgi:hypothetical protein
MKTRFIFLPLMCGMGVAMADGVETDGTASQTVAAPAQKQMAKPKHPPRGDLRYCLDLKTNEAIIRCAEKKPKK